MNIKKLVNNCFLVVSKTEDLKLIEQAKKEYNPNNILILFFHYDKKNIIKDHELIKYLENKSNMNINFINISNLYEEKIKIINTLDLYANKSKYMINLRKQVELKHIIDNLKDEIIQYKQILEYKGI